ncbi:ABC-type transport system, involved in lipoprotein release, permease component [Agreia bicolorata]|uniref:ABC-type transport system, involved in lipoprotein release, permease component n=1 Tax=Agreia bicolorata TaxID=110935 RepID=A0A1T4X1A7_9MICO|nr:FtsX-like permease family protein [Agreia bicolorata]SKA82651.1 ABC-type transport system, involved in lipoprotein release, permease component [Agreia bicolorata]
MFITYLRRELVNRRKQTIIIAVGMALAIALVIIVNSVAAGVKDAQTAVLGSVYGVGTDITISKAAAAPGANGTAGPGQRFDFGPGAGSTAAGTTAVASSRLTAGRSTATFDAASLGTVTGEAGVSAAAGVLSLNNTTFDGKLPDVNRTEQGSDRAQTGDGSAPTDGPGGTGGSSFNINSFTVLGLDPSESAVGPLSSVTLTDGRTLASDDTGTDVAVLDSAYATAAGLSVGGTIDIGGTSFQIVGLVESSSGDATTASNVYIPLDVAQNLSGESGKISSIYVQATSSDDIATLKTSLEAALPDNTVSTQSDLASSVSGSLSTASTLVGNLGTWLSIIVLAAAFLIAILFTISGVTRRTREFGTLKAIGWSNRRIVGQVAGESVVQGLLGGIAGVAIGLVGVLVVNLVAPTLTASTSGRVGGGFAGRGIEAAGGPGAAGGRFGQAAHAAATSDVVLNAPVTVSVILIAVALALAGGLLAGAVGGWRASRLRPAEALRSVA